MSNRMRGEAVKSQKNTRSWKPSIRTWLIFALLVSGMVAGLYPHSATWLSSYNQSQIITHYSQGLENINPSAEEHLLLAHKYNEALTAGVIVGSHEAKATGVGVSVDDSLVYTDMLSDDSLNVMSRLKIDAIKLDLPIYHGTSDETLLKGAGHLEGSHLPVGGDSTRSVITAHRGLASSTMFTNLDKMNVGDTFTLETFGRVLTYQVRETQVIAPEDTDTLKVVPGKDLVTLITCTPLGINTHRILVTGERITPTPERDLLALAKDPVVPGFPWWIVWGTMGLAFATGHLVWQGRRDARVR